MSDQEQWHDAWAQPPPWRAPSTQSSPISTASDLRERLARVEADLHWTMDQARINRERIHLLANRAQATDSRISLLERSADTRLTLLEGELRRSVAERAEWRPLLDQVKRSEERKRLLKDLLNWISVAGAAYFAWRGQIPWAAVLGKILGAG